MMDEEAVAEMTVTNHVVAPEVVVGALDPGDHVQAMTMTKSRLRTSPFQMIHPHRMVVLLVGEAAIVMVKDLDSPAAVVEQGGLRGQPWKPTNRMPGQGHTA